MKKLTALIRRHAQTLWYVLTVVLPVILRTGKRPVIFSKYSGIGDILCTFPTVLKLKERHPNATFIYNCYQPYDCLPAMGGITETVTHLRHIGVLRHWYGWLFASFYEFPSADEKKDSFCTQYLVKEYAKNHGVEVESHHPHLTISSSVSERTKAFLGSSTSPADLIVIHPGPTWPIKEWPRASWMELINKLKLNGHSNIIQIGTNSHLAMGTVNNVGLPGVTSLVNQLTLEECVAVIAKANLFVGVDSGLIHIAAALKIRGFGIFGPTNPKIILPSQIAAQSITSQIHCQGCHHRIPRIHWEKGCPHDAACMKIIPVAEVLAACLRLLPQCRP